jgi:hypothetical protein
MRASVGLKIQACLVRCDALCCPLQGTRQLDADVSALAAVFGQYTSRPGAHFKETKEACK